MTYISLIITITIALFWRNRKASMALILLAAILAISQQYIYGIGMLALIAVALLTRGYYYETLLPKAGKFILLWLLAFLGSMLILHDVPGFYNQVLAKVNITEISSAYIMYFNADKIFTSLILYTGSYLILEQKPMDVTSLWQTVLILVACVLVILVPAFVSGHVTFNPKLTNFFAPWALNNFLFVCFSEEVFFRGFIQKTIMQGLPKTKPYIFLGILSASIIFGLFHYREGLLPISIYQNALNNRPLLSPKYEKFAVFTDMERLYGNPPINIPLTLFKELDQQYPGSKFILNTRDKQAWLLSRATQPIMPNATPLLQMHANMLNKTQDEVLAMWSKEWDEHHQAVLEYFKDRPQDLLVFNIETDKPEKFVEFFKEYFILDPKLFGHKNKAASRAKEMKRERQVVEIFSKTYPLKPQQ